MIYYASKNLMDSETRYSCMDKLALATFIAILSLHFAPHNHRIGIPEPYVLHPDLSGAQGQVFPMDSYLTRV